jgi:hypothetical protein
VPTEEEFAAQKAKILGSPATLEARRAAQAAPFVFRVIVEEP